jgi:hypothetical protein
MINAFISGFSHTAEVINRLEDDGLIKPCAWIDNSNNTNDSKISLRKLLYEDISEIEISNLIPLKLYKKLYSKYFTLFLANISRLDSYTGEHTAYPKALNQFRWVVKYIYDLMVKNKIQVFLHSTYPHEVVDTVAFLISKELGIKTLLMPPLFYSNPSRFFIIEDLNEYGLWRDKKIINDKACFDISDYTMSNNSVLTNNLDEFNERKNNAIKAKFPKGVFNRFLNAFYEGNLRNATIKDFDIKKEKYVFFPLHYQPEATIISQADVIWDDLILFAEQILSIIPDDCYLLIKEHPMQTFYNRDSIFFKRLSQMSGVIFASTQIDSNTYIENSEFVATPLGTAGFEALSRSKAVVFSGYAPYREFHGAFELNDSLIFEDIVNANINIEKVISDGQELLKRTYLGNPNPEHGPSDHENIENIYKAIKHYLSVTNVNEHNYASIYTTSNANKKYRIHFKEKKLIFLLKSLILNFLNKYRKP